MLKRLIIFLSFCIVLSSCKKSESNGGCRYSDSGIVVPASEMASLQAYIAGSHPGAILNSGGFYYEIVSAGTGVSATSLCSTVGVKYAGYLTNNFKFTSAAEESTGASYALGSLIPGWQRGLPLVKAGGTINLYLPPSLGYGANATATIPANSILIFTIQVLAVYN